jgi:transposase
LKGEFTKLEKAKNSIVRQVKPCKQLMSLEGAAEVCAGMLYSSKGNGKQFKNALVEIISFMLLSL